MRSRLLSRLLPCATLACSVLLTGCGQTTDDASQPTQAETAVDAAGALASEPSVSEQSTSKNSPSTDATPSAPSPEPQTPEAEPSLPPEPTTPTAPPAPPEPPAPPANVQPQPRAVAPVVTRLPLPQPTAAETGAWGPVVPWPMIPIHASVLPDGRVVTFGTTKAGVQTAMFDYDIWDSFAGTDEDSHLTLPNQTATDVFCGSNLVLPLTGELLINGGDNYSTGTQRSTNTANQDATLLVPSRNTLERAGTMQRPRWYGSAITLPNGETYLQGGKGGNDRAEIRGLNGQFRLLTGFATNDLSSSYPRVFVAPDGKVFGLGYTKMFKIDPFANNGAGTRTDLGTTTGYAPAWETPVVMFRPGRILLAGGNDTKAAVIDIRDGAPVIRSAGRISQVRKWANATVLADGRVAVTGGSTTANAAVNVAYHVELFSPDESHPDGGTWASGPAAQRMRLYHSVSVLLPDATLFTGGGGAPGPQTNLNAEIYYPPYLFSADGSLAPRPRITQAPVVLAPGARFDITTPQAAAIRRVTLVRTGDTTHSLDRGQHFIELGNFSRNGNTLTLDLPPNANDTPPGHYMLFVIDAAGVPSVAPVVSIAPAAT